MVRVAVFLSTIFVSSTAMAFAVADAPRELASGNCVRCSQSTSACFSAESGGTFCIFRRGKCVLGGDGSCFPLSDG
jgi:hypothetical protein